MEEVTLFKITEIGENVSVQAKATPNELISAFATAMNQSDMMKKIIEAALVLSTDEAFSEGIISKHEGFEKIIKTQGDA